jgi:predicted dehydrogenase
MVNHHDASRATAATFRFLGTAGILSGTIGSMYDYPHGRTDTLAYARHGDALVDIPLTGLWIPDAFIGPMASLMHAIQTGTDPITSARDNIATLQLVHGAYRSAHEGRTIAPDTLLS